MRNRDEHSDFWGEPIHSYSRAQAIADGVLVDLTTTTDDKGQLLCQQAGFKRPVAITRAAWSFSTRPASISTSSSTSKAPLMRNRDEHSDFWGEPIHAYTRAQAIRDGVLVDLTTAMDDKGQLLCQQAGFKVPVAIARAAWAATIEAGGTWKSDGDGETLELRGGQSLTSRLWDVLAMLRLAITQASDTDRVHFRVLVDVKDDGHREPVKLWALCGPGDDARPVITILLEGED